MEPNIGGEIIAARIPDMPKVKTPRLKFRKKHLRGAEKPEIEKKKEEPEKKEKPEIEKKKEEPGIVGRFLNVIKTLPERIKVFREWLKLRLITGLGIVGSREFLVVAAVFSAYIAGFVLWQRYSSIIAYILTGIVVSAVIYKMYSDLKKEKDALLGEKDTLKLLGDRSRGLLENALDCVFTLDLQGNITSFNRKAEQVTGYSKKDVIGNSLGMFLTPEGIKDFFDKLHQATRSGVVRGYELEINTVYGKRKFEMNLTVIKKRDKIIGVQGIGRDVTDKKRLEKELKMAMSDLERWSKRTVKKEMTILEMKNQIKAIKKELETHGGRNN
jgi:PAS domain S-box-containing protein